MVKYKYIKSKEFKVPKYSSKLSPKQKLFCERYVANKFNATEAAEYAGYSKKTAYSQGARTLKKVEVQAYISKLIKKTLGSTDKLSLKIIKTLEAIAFSNITDVMYWGDDGEVKIVSSNELDEANKASISEINSRSIFSKEGEYLGTDMRIKQVDKLKALDMLARFVQLYETGKDKEEEKQGSSTYSMDKKERTDRLLAIQEQLKKIKK